ncbi:hypothetical protein [Maribacter sp. 2308TA10-17]|uniref:hypothetical protein n=1 Tax=Maribacter sp. 2308TA10-17 TaxID=3386276 RepID=UPI0039BD7B85
MQPNSFIKTLSLIHLSLCASIGFFAGFAFVQNGSFSTSNNQNSIFIYLIPIVAMAGYFASKFVYQNLIKNFPKEEPLSKKLQRYQIANIFKYALLEGPAILALVIYYNEGNALYLVIAICLLAYLLFQKPKLEKLKSELPLSLEEEKEFDTLN